MLKQFLFFQKNIQGYFKITLTFLNGMMYVFFVPLIDAARHFLEHRSMCVEKSY